MFLQVYWYISLVLEISIQARLNINKLIHRFYSIEYTSLRRDSIWLRESVVKQDSYCSSINWDTVDELSGLKSSWVHKVLSRIR